MTFPTALLTFAFLGLPALGVSQTTDTICVNVHNHEIVLYRTGVAVPGSQPSAATARLLEWARSTRATAERASVGRRVGEW